MNLTRNLTLTVALAIGGIAVAADNTPDILIPGFENAQVINGLSNNGKYGVSSIYPDAAGFSYTTGAVLYDLTGSRPVATDLSMGHQAVAATDVTDDGSLVVGMAALKPAVCRKKDGKWGWEYLPVPDKTFEVEMEDFQTEEITMARFKLNGGRVAAVTPDGKYAVGTAYCNEYELVEQAVMWDLTTGTIIDVPIPVRGIDGVDYQQTRFMQLSNDGRYLLAWNAFSYEGAFVYVFDRQNNEVIYIDVEKNADGSFSERTEGYRGVDMDGFTGKSLSSDGRYVVGGTADANDNKFVFRFDTKTREFKVFDDGIHLDADGWSVTKDGMPLGATPSNQLYADAIICYDDFHFPFSYIYDDVYGMNMERRYGIDVTGKPTLVSDDGLTVFFVTGNKTGYLARFKEPLTEVLKRVNLMSDWTISPAPGTSMSAFSTFTVTFDNPIEVDASRSREIALKDSKGNTVANPLANGGIQARGANLVISFRDNLLNAGETYTLSIPAGICWVAGRPNNSSPAIEVLYSGRENQPVAVKKIDPAAGTSLPNLSLEDNPVQVTFDAAVRINPALKDRPIARLYIDDSTEPYASFTLDVDLNTNTLVAYPASTVYLYKGSDYTLKVPEGTVTDLSGMGANKAFEITYKGSYTPQIGDEKYLFRSTCDNFDNFLFYDGDKKEPTTEYANMGFTKDTTPWWVVRDSEDDADMAFGSHSSYKDGGQADDWVVIRQLKIPTNVNSYLAFQSQSYRKSKTDRLKVYIYEYNESLNQLTSTTIANIRKNGVLVYDEVQSPGNSEDIMAGEWRDNIIPLEDYKGKNIYICFVNDNQAQSMVMIDNIEVVKEVHAFLTITSPVNVVNEKSSVIKGIVTVESELASYSALEMTLLDADENEVSTLNATFSTPLKAGDTYNFEFPQQLPLTVGVENPYSIVYSLDDDEMDYNGVVRDLSFETTKRVVVEEYTGRDCQYCPLGILAMENLEEIYGEKVIPVVLHAYQGDPKGLNITGYAGAVFGASPAAPSAIINRGGYAVTPMEQDSKHAYQFTAALTGKEPLWQDVVAQELTEAALLDVDLKAEPSRSQSKLLYTATVKSPLTLDNQNIRVLGVLMEDNLLDSQRNALYSTSDENLGKFGRGGQYGNATFYYYFNNVARGIWGTGANGTARLIPAKIENGKEYEVEIEFPIPAIVSKPANTKMAVILIDENTGRIINAAVEQSDVTAVDEIISDESAANLEITKVGSEIVVAAAGDVEVAAYSLDGRLLAKANGNGSVTLDLSGHRGVTIVRAAAAGQVKSLKVMM